ncbi:P-loop containing nucleoside triphosphate hydrolase protein [Gonapodya prolifera JEL478]|uniref:DNA repair protein RAD51 homolog 3 n=1 Tax=Gonapodya prolifera (strain JEL478) TaxID=1344416 RepID=A0A139ATI6_GONPJ|nr:P-loop containing nucleoside triphosphate hydrolase protein [Gonapodya prolifera JEL478]|eukprot:KXS20047.1 P-loop containing nucleoside triphosphate hydrolase protein [Gonapodya prolifera JEL478]
MQLCVNVQIPTILGGFGGQAIYIDTEGSFFPDRLIQIANATVLQINLDLRDMSARMQNPSAAPQNPPPSTPEPFEVSHLLDRIHYYRCHDCYEVAAVANLMEVVLDQNPDVKLVVLDSAAFHFRYSPMDYSERTKLLLAVGGRLQGLAKRFRVAVFVTNQLTARVDKSTSRYPQGGGGGGSRADDGPSHTLIPALGEAWNSSIERRVVMGRRRAGRVAYLAKSPEPSSDVVEYAVTPHGFRDVGPPAPARAFPLKRPSLFSPLASSSPGLPLADPTVRGGGAGGGVGTPNRDRRASGPGPGPEPRAGTPVLPGRASVWRGERRVPPSADVLGPQRTPRIVRQGGVNVNMGLNENGKRRLE